MWVLLIPVHWRSPFWIDNPPLHQYADLVWVHWRLRIDEQKGIGKREIERRVLRARWEKTGKDQRNLWAFWDWKWVERGRLEGRNLGFVIRLQIKSATMDDGGAREFDREGVHGFDFERMHLFVSSCIKIDREWVRRGERERWVERNGRTKK